MTREFGDINDRKAREAVLQ